MNMTLPSNRSFGWTFTGACAIAAIFYPWAAVVACLTAVVTLTRVSWLTPLNRAWMTLGELISRVVNPLVLGLIFFAVFTPVAFVMRLAGRDVLTRKWDAGRRSYWSERDPPGPAEDSFKNMF
ncbi:conserved protein of unknown function [Georgfuchsia toluolica]|uniref:Uncharacterized protein n=1 Tax=Georgfuchsia toluolica TaxID=424218 RepID=A0A916J5Q1_9PROT|nr:SxtJ family membrane protein [Georgfuchsia toluolica]CAG4882919.1 conserved protein of unknown function [Georgfuchsia toluolica]